MWCVGTWHLPVSPLSISSQNIRMHTLPKAALLTKKSGKFWVQIHMHCNKKSHLFIPFLGIARHQSQFAHSCVCERFIYSQDLPTYFPAAEQADGSWKYINFSQTYEFRSWETELYNSVLEITVSFLGIHKWEPDIYIYWILTGPSFAVCEERLFTLNKHFSHFHL